MSDVPEQAPGVHPRLHLDDLLVEMQAEITNVLTVRDRMYRLLDAVVAIGGDLEPHEILVRLVDLAREMTGARYGALGVLDDTGKELGNFVYRGFDPGVAERIGHLPTGLGVLGVLISEPRPIRLTDLSAHPGSVGFPEGHPPMRTFLGVPILIKGRPYGNLYLTEKADHQEFDEADEGIVVALAAAASVAIENSRLSRQAQLLAVYEDRDRIARNLHDLVIQRLFALGMRLQSASRHVDADPGQVAARIDEAVDDIDATIREIRMTIYSLQRSTGRLGTLRSRVLEAVEDLSSTLDFEPGVDFRGLVDSGVPDDIGHDLVAVVREAVTNVAKHAHAHTARIDLNVTTDAVELEVRDDGIGPASDRQGSGLANLAARAERHHGRCEVTATEPGTLVRWRVPIPK